MLFRFTFSFTFVVFRFEDVGDRRWRRGHFVKDVLGRLVSLIGICAKVKTSVDRFPEKIEKN